MITASSRKRLLRVIRHALAAGIAAAMTWFPSLEPLVVKAGRALSRRSRLLSGLYWFTQESLMARLRASGERYRPVPVMGHRLQLDITDATGRYPFFYKSAYEPAVTDAIVTALRPGDVFLDVGANIGYFSVLAARTIAPGGRVIAFEPHGGARDALETLVQRNEVSAIVEVVPMALADTEGEATLFTEEGINAHSTIEPALSPMRQVAILRPAENVRTTTLDNWIARRPDLIPRVRCIKIDVEGAEERVLAGMSQMLRSRSLTIVCETTTGSPADSRLIEAGFQRRRIEPGTSAYGNFLYVRP